MSQDEKPRVEMESRPNEAVKKPLFRKNSTVFSPLDRLFDLLFLPCSNGTESGLQPSFLLDQHHWPLYVLPTLSLGIAVIGQFLNVVHHAVQIPLHIHLGFSTVVQSV